MKCHVGRALVDAILDATVLEKLSHFDNQGQYMTPKMCQGPKAQCKLTKHRHAQTRGLFQDAVKTSSYTSFPVLSLFSNDEGSVEKPVKCLHPYRLSPSSWFWIGKIFFLFFSTRSSAESEVLVRHGEDVATVKMAKILATAHICAQTLAIRSRISSIRLGNLYSDISHLFESLADPNRGFRARCHYQMIFPAILRRTSSRGAQLLARLFLLFHQV